MRSYSQVSEFDILLDLDTFKSLPHNNVAINPCKLHHSTTKIVVRKLFTNRQTKKQTSRQKHNLSPTLLAEVKMLSLGLTKFSLNADPNLTDALQC